MTPHWTIYSLEYHLGGIAHSNPDSLWKDLVTKGWTASSWKARSMSFAHVRPTSTGFTVRLFGTLSAAIRFHRKSA